MGTMRYLINPGNRDRAQRAIDELKRRFAERKAFTVEFDEARPRHSDEQRGYYWASLKEWGKHLGYNAKETEEILHREIMCRAFGIERTIERGGMVINIPNGSSSKLSKQAYSELIQELIITAGEDGYTIAPPGTEET